MNLCTNLLARTVFGLALAAGPHVLLAQTPAAPAPALPAPLRRPRSMRPTSSGRATSLQIFVWRQPELSVSVPVRPDGKVSTPLVEDIVAVGKTPSQLAREMEKVLSEYVRSPQVNVIVSQPISTYSQVKIIGQVAKPQALPFREGITALDAVLAVGGLAPFAAGNRAKIVRTEKGKQRELRIKLDDIINKGDMKQNVLLQPGDVLVVPESRF